jgi:hypothetical protein
MRRSDLVLLAMIHGAGCPTQSELAGWLGQSVERPLARLSKRGFVKSGSWSVFRGRDVEPSENWQLVLTEAGRIALKVAYGRDCDWCDSHAVGGRRLKHGATYIYFCEPHREIAEASAETEPASKGSLYGQIRTGKIGTIEPDEVAV